MFAGLESVIAHWELPLSVTVLLMPLLSMTCLLDEASVDAMPCWWISLLTCLLSMALLVNEPSIDGLPCWWVCCRWHALSKNILSMPSTNSQEKCSIPFAWYLTLGRFSSWFLPCEWFSFAWWLRVCSVACPVRMLDVHVLTNNALSLSTKPMRLTEHNPPVLGDSPLSQITNALGPLAWQFSLCSANFFLFLQAASFLKRHAHRLANSGVDEFRFPHFHLPFQFFCGT